MQYILHNYIEYILLWIKKVTYNLGSLSFKKNQLRLNCYINYFLSVNTIILSVDINILLFIVDNESTQDKHKKNP